jgi:hypothetical protein
MGQGGLTALRAGDWVDRSQGVVSATLVALGLGRATLGYGHGYESSFVLSVQKGCADQ